VVLSYLREFTAAITVPEETKSKEDPAKQTQAVEKLLKNVIFLFTQYNRKLLKNIQHLPIHKNILYIHLINNF